MTKRLPGMEQFGYQNSLDMPPEDEVDFRNHLKSLKYEFHVKESEKTPELAARIDSMIGAYQELLKELGIDVARRTVPTEKISVYDEDSWGEMSKELNQPKISNGVSLYESGQIFLRRAPGVDDTVRRLSHELAHVLSSRTLKVEASDLDQEGTYGVRRAGFENLANGAFHYFNEVVTELASVEAYRRDLLRRGRDADKVPECGYSPGVLVFDHLLAEAGRRLGQDGTKLRFQLFRGYFEGDMNALRFFDQAFGAGSLRKLASLDGPRYSLEELEMFVQDIGVDTQEFRRRVDAAIPKRTYKLESGINLTGETQADG